MTYVSTNYIQDIFEYGEETTMDIISYLQGKEVHAMPFSSPREDNRLLEALREMFADQNKQLSQQNQQLNAQGQLLAQQGQRMENVLNQISTIVQQQEAMRLDFNARWQDLPRLYVPRQEHQAVNLDARTATLEEFRVAATKDIGDLKFSLQQQIQTAIETASKDIVAAQIAAKEELNTTRQQMDGRQIAALVSGITVLVSVAVEVILKIIFH